MEEKPLGVGSNRSPPLRSGRVNELCFKSVLFTVSLFGKYFLGFSFGGKIFFGLFRNDQFCRSLSVGKPSLPPGGVRN